MCYNKYYKKIIGTYTLQIIFAMSLYSLVRFVDDTNEYNIDIVPTDWIFYQKEDSQLYCRFIGENSSVEDAREVQKLVRKLGPPNENWKSHRIAVEGEAG